MHFRIPMWFAIAFVCSLSQVRAAADRAQSPNGTSPATAVPRSDQWETDAARDAGPPSWNPSPDRGTGNFSEPLPPIAEPLTEFSPAEGTVAGGFGICNPLNACGDPDCSIAVKCAATCFGNPLCAPICGGSGCSIGCSPGPCGPGCSLECIVASCPLTACSRPDCEPECNLACIFEYDPCACYGQCNILCLSAQCNPDCNPLIPPHCNPACGGNICATGCLDRCNNPVCAGSALCDSSCNPLISPTCNPLCAHAFDPCACDPGPCNSFCPEFDPCLCYSNPCNPACGEAFDLCACAPGVCNPACPEFDYCKCAEIDIDPENLDPCVCDPCGCAPGICNPACPEFDPCQCADIEPNSIGPCACDPCGPTCKPECNPLCTNFNLCTCEPCACNPCGPTCKPECNPACAGFDECACAPGPCNPFCDEFDVCACEPCLSDGFGHFLCEAAQKDPCPCSPCSPGCPDRCSPNMCYPICNEDCPLYDLCQCYGPCNPIQALECFDLVQCLLCGDDRCSEECRAEDPCLSVDCPGFDPCDCNPCLCDPREADPGFDLCICDPCRAECHPECNPACGAYDPCKCSSTPCVCDECGPTCFPECNPACNDFSQSGCIQSADCNPAFGGESLCNPLCGGDPCNSIHCPLFAPLCRIVSIVDCLSGPETLPTGPGEPVTPFDCIRVFDSDGDGDVDMADVKNYLGPRHKFGSE